MADPFDISALKMRDAPLNAFVDWDEEAKSGEGALSGMTIGVKANIAVAGLPWSAGLKAYRSRIAERDAETVSRLRSAGAAIIGTLNMEEGALGSKSDNPFFGAVQNPHRIGYSPGGSSGGSAAAVAAGLVDLALGTDTMGSIRIPASHCGIYGFKPATASVSQDGLEPADLALDAIGPLARNLATLEQAARVISGFGDGSGEYGGAVLAGHGVEVDAEVAATFERALAALPEAPAQASLSESNSRIRFAGFIRTARAMAQHLDGVEGMSAHLQGLLSYGRDRPAEKLVKDFGVLEQAKAEVRQIVQDHGFLIMPTVPNPPFPHSDPEPAAQADFTCLANIAGLPAISIPAGWTAGGLPVGVQIVGQVGHEAGLFALARFLDGKLAAYRPPAAS
ncbi:amidase [Paraurantiacibacter namhicola]|uniref:Glutamyl-tRNA(Gln) amidotransferase subunit A n=1 Tax=Paraurantiacibacter namhicola TaxID=645517 RepID=A0A1C7D4I1_9SPHN|nr:amidase [Paraurantiacibacter namhicola]ANU06364.1 Glutamyl-tRNA(Gln) amidotransferase subunit A [Paraurantiacibacter namhicola]